MFPAYVILEGIEALPTLPEVVTLLATQLRDECASAADIEQTVRVDPAITANLIRTANSVYYSGLAPISSTRDAISRIGFQRVYEVAIGSSLKRAIPKRIPGYGISGPKFWHHCIATACIAEALANEVKPDSSDMAFTAGLLHDVGQLVIGNFLDEMMPESNWWTFGTNADERRTLGCNHNDVGHEIAAKWNLPQAVRQTCRWHHEFEFAPKDSDLSLIAIVQLANSFAYISGFDGGSCMGEVFNPESQQYLGLTMKQLIEISKELKPAINEMAASIS
jgi:putative nucleotidyltransferase with HDIG domain